MNRTELAGLVSLSLTWQLFGACLFLWPIAAQSAPRTSPKSQAPQTMAPKQKKPARSSDERATSDAVEFGRGVRMNAGLLPLGVCELEWESPSTRYRSWVWRFAFATPLMDVYLPELRPRGLEGGVEFRVRPQGRPDIAGFHIGLGLDLGGIWSANDPPGAKSLDIWALTASAGYEWMFNGGIGIGISGGLSGVLLISADGAGGMGKWWPRGNVNVGYHF
jgi:hypothetical protein